MMYVGKQSTFQEWLTDDSLGGRIQSFIGAILIDTSFQSIKTSHITRKTVF